MPEQNGEGPGVHVSQNVRIPELVEARGIEFYLGEGWQSSRGMVQGGAVRTNVSWAAIVGLLTLIAFVSGSSIIYTLLFALLAVPVVGYVASIFAARRLSGEVRRLTPFLQVGQTMEEQVTLHNLHWFPKLLLEAEHDSSPFGSNGKVLSLWPYKSSSWTSTKHCARRGLYRFGKLRVKSRDPLGLFDRTLEFGEEQVALIYPATVDLPGFFVPSGHGWTEGLVRGRMFTPSVVASSVREYVPGDAVNHIHWPATAHMGKMMVKEYEREPSGPADAVWVILNLDARVQGGVDPDSSAEYSVTIAASVAKRFLDAGRTVGLVANGAVEQIVHPAVGMGQIGRILTALALAEPGGGTLIEAAKTVSKELTKGASAVLISSASTIDVATAAQWLSANGAGVVPVIVEASSFEGNPPARGANYRLPGTNLDAYVVHRGDEIELRLDYRIHGSGKTAAAVRVLGVMP